MLKVIQCFGKHCSCHLQGEYDGRPFFGRQAGGKWDMTDLTGGVGEQAAIQLAMNMWLRKRGDEKFLLRGTW
jgi:hypothetical protein